MRYLTKEISQFQNISDTAFSSMGKTISLTLNIPTLSVVLCMRGIGGKKKKNDMIILSLQK